MNNTSSLFENLMLMHESNEQRGRKIPLKKIDESKKRIDESDTTLLNLTVELPTDKEDIEPEDVKVDVGVMPIENEDEPVEDDVDVTPEDENEDSSEDKPIEDENEEETKEPEKEESLQLEGKDCKCTGKEDCECESCKAKKEAADVDAAKRRIIARANGEDECSNLKESLMHLDTTSLNKLITNFVRDNYKNIDKVVINKAILENHKLTLKGFVKNNKGLKEAITLVNRGFDGTKLENKRFLIDFADAGNMFNVVKESIRKPFVFTASLKKGNLKFESLKYNFKTRIDESKVAKIYGNCVLTESIKTESSSQRQKFNNIINKINSAKSLSDLTGIENEINTSNMSDTFIKTAKELLNVMTDEIKTKG